MQTLKQIFDNETPEQINIKEIFTEHFPNIYVGGNGMFAENDSIDNSIHTLRIDEDGGKRDGNCILMEKDMCSPYIVKTILESIEDVKNGKQHSTYASLKSISDAVEDVRNSKGEKFFCSVCRKAHNTKDYGGYIFASTFCKPCLEQDVELQKAYDNSQRPNYYD